MLRRIRCFKGLNSSLWLSAELSKANQNFETSNRGINEVWERMFVTRMRQWVLLHKLLIRFTVWVMHWIWDKLPQTGSIWRQVDVSVAHVRWGHAVSWSARLAMDFGLGALKRRVEHCKGSLEVKSNVLVKCWYMSYRKCGPTPAPNLKNMYLILWLPEGQQK